MNALDLKASTTSWYERSQGISLAAGPVSGSRLVPSYERRWSCIPYVSSVVSTRMAAVGTSEKRLVLCRMYVERSTPAQGRYDCQKLVRVVLDPITYRIVVTGTTSWNCH